MGRIGHPQRSRTFTYDLASHPGGDAEPPADGLRLDELLDVTCNHDVWSFEFDDALGDDSVRIFGTVFGGFDTGTGCDDPTRRGLWVWTSPTPRISSPRERAGAT